MPKPRTAKPHAWRQLALLLLALGLHAASASAALPPAQPFAVRVSANGFAALTVDRDAAKTTGFWPHLYAQRSPQETTPNLLYDAYFGVQVGASPPQWATALPQAVTPDAFGWLAATGVVEDRRSTGATGVVLTTRVFAPMTLPAPGAVLLAELHNTGSTAQSVTLAALANLHLGPAATPLEGESIHPLGSDALVETDALTGHRVLYRAIGTAQLSREASNPYQKWLNGQPFSANASATGSDRVAGLAWPAQLLQPGQTVKVGYLLLYGVDTDDVQLQLASDIWLAGRSADQVLADELADWQAWHDTGQVPAGLDAEAQVVLARSQAVLRMAQVREPDVGPAGQNQTPHGQIVASLPPGIWHIAWLRDQAYAAVALTAAGHVTEARAALDFVLNGQTGGYASYFGGPYLVSPVRYFGGGLEESDVNADGPNIELDGLGLFLWQAARYVAASGDTAWLAANWPALRDKAAARILALRDPTGLLQKDSSIWEVHWNGKQKHFTYSNLVAVRGLCGAAELAELGGEPGLAATYRATALAMRDAVLSHLVGTDHVLRGNLEEPAPLALDAAAVEAFLDGQIDPGSATALATWTAWQQKLGAGGGPGLIRNDDGGLYDSAEWLFIDLRVVRMLERMAAAGQGTGAAAAALRARVLALAGAGGGVIPELVATQGPSAGQFDGAIPMAGFGAGAMSLWLGGEAWGDDLKACLTPTAVADDAGGGADAGSAADGEATPDGEADPDGSTMADGSALADGEAAADSGGTDSTLGTDSASETAGTETAGTETASTDTVDTFTDDSAGGAHDAGVDLLDGAPALDDTPLVDGVPAVAGDAPPASGSGCSATRSSSGAGFPGLAASWTLAAVLGARRRRRHQAQALQPRPR